MLLYFIYDIFSNVTKSWRILSLSYFLKPSYKYANACINYNNNKFLFMFVLPGLSNANLDRVPGFLYYFSNLKDLDLSANSINELQYQCRNWEMLISINLRFASLFNNQPSNNNILAAPLLLSEVSSIEVIYLAGNFIKTVPSSWESLINLVEIVCF